MVVNDTFRQYDPTKPGYGRRLTAKEWEHFRPICTELHEDGLKREEIYDRLKVEHGYLGTYSVLHKKFKEWGLKVYGPEGRNTPVEIPRTEYGSMIDLREFWAHIEDISTYAEARDGNIVPGPEAEASATEMAQVNVGIDVADPPDTLPSPRSTWDPKAGVLVHYQLTRLPLSSKEFSKGLSRLSADPPLYGGKRGRSNISSAISSMLQNSTSSCKSFFHMAKRLRESQMNDELHDEGPAQVFDFSTLSSWMPKLELVSDAPSENYADDSFPTLPYELEPGIIEEGRDTQVEPRRSRFYKDVPNRPLESASWIREQHDLYYSRQLEPKDYLQPPCAHTSRKRMEQWQKAPLSCTISHREEHDLD